MKEFQAVIVFSGGMDSITLLHHTIRQGYNAYGISFYYGQRHEKELEFAKYWGEKLCVQWHRVDISFMKLLAGNSALLAPNMPLPYEHYTHENQKITVVPNRNMVMLSIAIAWAENMGIGKVFFAPHINDKSIYPDCRREFVEALDRASRLGTYNKVEISAPFIQMYKYEIVQVGQKLRVDYGKTWTCYEGREKHCGRCATCQERKEAFQKADVVDPTEYEE